MTRQMHTRVDGQRFEGFGQVVLPHLDPPDEADGADERRAAGDHGEEAEEAEDVLAAEAGVGEHQERRDHVVQAPDDGDEQRRDDHRAREDLQGQVMLFDWLAQTAMIEIAQCHLTLLWLHGPTHFFNLQQQMGHVQ